MKFGSVDHRPLCSGTRDLHPRPYFLLRGLGEIGYQGGGKAADGCFEWMARTSLPLTAAFGFCFSLSWLSFGEAICNPGIPAVAVAGSDQLDSVSLVTPEGVERTTGTASGRRPWWPKSEG
ncbi:hypothetical protein HZ326_12788 [Fusarium oxysporum f. sp. albedinis]|nr:hypothetical protein HZ326_12788 [Fusarium oxysporum f. sp. albedinis]